MVSESNFVAGSGAAQAYARWDSRRQTLGDGRAIGDNSSPQVEGSLFEALKVITSTAALDKALTDGSLPDPVVGAPYSPDFHSIGFSPAELISIEAAISSGAALPVAPQQYGLAGPELRMLFDVRRLAANADSTDWDQVHHILTGVERRRFLHPQWLVEEQGDGLALSPDIFHIPSPSLLDLLSAPQLTTGFLQWRTDLRRQREWQLTLQGRLEQEHAVEPTTGDAIGAAEEASLPFLRDELIKATVTSAVGGQSLEERKRWVMNHLLINAFENGCRQVTRVGQAIETTQLMLWGIHNRQLEEQPLTLENAEDFAEQWTWLGSYATWRTAMFTYLYPENLLIPELRRPIGDPDTDPTKLFGAIAKIASGQAPRPSTPSDSEVDEGGDPVEEDGLGSIIDAIYRLLGKIDPTSLEGQTLIARDLITLRPRISSAR